MMSSKLWIEFAHQTSPDADGEPNGALVRTLTTESCALALVASGEMWGAPESRAALGHAWDALAQGADFELTVERLLAVLPTGVHLPWALFRAGPSSANASRFVHSVECDAPPLFFARRGEFLLPPVIEEEAHGRLVRRCDFEVCAGDHLAMVNERYIRARGGARPWSWRDIAVSIRRLTATGCDAEQLAGALVRLAGLPASVLAVFVRPMRSATVWSGPASQHLRDPDMLRQFLAEEDMRIICGDTTAEIAARLLGADLAMDPPPEEGWREVPPTSRLTAPDGSGVAALITEGVVTMQAACKRLAVARRPHELAGRQDGASRLARLLLTADRVRFLVGLAVNPAQMAPDGAPLRISVIEKLADDLRARGKIVSIARF